MQSQVSEEGRNDILSVSGFKSASHESRRCSRVCLTGAATLLFQCHASSLSLKRTGVAGRNFERNYRNLVSIFSQHLEGYSRLLFS